RRVCCERPTPTADYQPSFHSPWLAANVVVLNKGDRDGLEPGHVMKIFQGGETIRDVVAGGGTTVKLPLEEAGLLMVFRIFDRVSFALIMHATQPLHVLDWVRSPEG
ncbi:MAG: hypothetical protein M3H12_16015, partial [Chromatiales bacterium]